MSKYSIFHRKEEKKSQKNQQYKYFVTHLEINDDNFNINTLNQYKNLVDLKIQNIFITNTDALINCTKLKQLIIKKCGGVSSFDFLPKLFDIEVLLLRESKLRALSITSANTKLRVLDLFNNNQLYLLTGLENCHSLKQLDIRTTGIKELSIPDNLKQLGIGNEEVPRIIGLKNLEQLEELNTIDTNIKILNIPPEMKNLKKINANYCYQLTQITGLENCHQLEISGLQDTQLQIFKNEQDLQNDYQSNIFISVPETELVLLNIKHKLVKIEDLEQTNTKVKQHTLLRCDCNYLLCQILNGKTQIQLAMDKFHPSCLAITNCQNITSIQQYINNFTELKLIHNDIADLSFIRENINLQSLKIEYCEQLTDINSISIAKQLKQLILTNTHVQDFSSVMGLNYLKYVNIINNHRQEADLIMKHDNNESTMQKTRLLLFKQFKQTRYQLRKDFKIQYELLASYDNHNKRRVNYGYQLCVDIINKMLEIIE